MELQELQAFYRQLLEFKPFQVLVGEMVDKVEDLKESNELIEQASSLNKKGFPKIDSLHLACAIISKCEYFLTTDDKILKLSNTVKDININDPIGFIKEVLS